MQLYCRTGFHIGIFSDGKVRGIDQDLDDFGKLVCLVMLTIAEIHIAIKSHRVSECVTCIFAFLTVIYQLDCIESC